MFSSFIIDIPSSRRNLGKAMGSILSAAILAGIFIASSTLSGCQPHEGSEEQLKADIDSFATYYYNWQFPKAIKFCTASSEPWLKYAASNVHEADVELLRNKEADATVEINDIDFGDDEVSAIADITVRNFLQMDSIGKEAHLVEEADFLLPMCMEEGVWKVRMASLPQSGKKNHD